MTADPPKANILIVDDTRANLELLSNILKAAGYHVRPAPSGRLALRAAHNQPPDLILLDINMPEMDGFAVCRRLKVDPQLQEIPVLFISALTDTKDKLKAFNAGGLDYITKPFQAEEVLARVATHLSIQRYQRELVDKHRSLQQALDELKAAQSQLIQAEKMASLGVLTAGIAHEINNPINFIKTSAHALEQDMADLKRLLEAFDRCEEKCPNPAATERLSAVKVEIDYHELISELPKLITNINLGVARTEAVVNGLRTYSRPDDEKKTPAAIAELIDTSLVLLENRTKKKVTIHKAYADLPQVPAQPSRLMQVFINVIGNAIDAVGGPQQTAPPAIEIHTGIETRDGRTYAVVRIIDNGPGMNKTVAARIFDPFFTTKAVGEGLGLGMSISFGIIRDHDGRIDVDNGRSKGTRVSIFLPMEREPA